MSNIKSENNTFTLGYLQKEDIPQYLELMRTVFGQTNGVDTFTQKLINHHPTMTLKNFLVIKHHDKIVASLNLIPVKWSIGGIPLQVAEMGQVATLAEYRHRGLQRRLVEEFHKQAAEQGYDLCAIEGIPYFYRQFGYEYALPLLEETKIRLEQIPDYESNLTFRPFTEEDIPKTMQLLGESQKKFYVHAIRDQQIWKMQHETGITGADKFEGYVAEKDRNLIAYFRISSDLESKTLILREVSDADCYMNTAILKFLKDYGKQHGLDVLVTQTSYNDPLTQQLVSLGATQHLPTYAWQIRVVDYVKIFEKMKPPFEQRLASSIYCNLTETLNFNFRRYTVQMVVENGLFTKIHRIEDCADRTLGLNPLVFVQLLLGYRSRQELEMIYPDFNIRQTHKHLIDVLFPKLPSHIHAAY